MKRNRLILAALAVLVCGLTVRAADEPERPGLPANAGLSGRKKIVFLSGMPSHGYAQHEQYAGCMLLARDLNENMPNVEAVVYRHKWPTDPHAFDGAAAIVIFSDGGPSHMAIPHMAELAPLMDRGVGLGMIHYAVEVPKGEAGDNWLKWIGGYFETYYSINPEWTAHFTHIPEHEVTRGVHPFTTHDEWYYNIRFRPGMEGVTPILQAVPPDSTRSGKDGAYSGNPTVRAGLGKNQAETTVWVATRPDGGRGFGCTGAHHHWNWAQNDFRKTILNCIVWIAHIEVPPDGVPSKTPTLDELLANQDKPTPANFDREKVQSQIDRMNEPNASGQ